MVDVPAQIHDHSIISENLGRLAKFDMTDNASHRAGKIVPTQC